MSWPPSPSANFIVNASTTTTDLRWGTDGLYGSAIAKSARRQDMVEEILIPNGTGLTAWHILLVDGVEYELTIVWDGNGAPLAIGSTPTLYDPMSASSYQFIVTGNPINLNRKQEGEWSLTAKYFSNASIP